MAHWGHCSPYSRYSCSSYGFLRPDHLCAWMCLASVRICHHVLSNTCTLLAGHHKGLLFGQRFYTAHGAEPSHLSRTIRSCVLCLSGSPAVVGRLSSLVTSLADSNAIAQPPPMLTLADFKTFCTCFQHSEALHPVTPNHCFLFSLLYKINSVCVCVCILCVVCARVFRCMVHEYAGKLEEKAGCSVPLRQVSP